MFEESGQGASASAKLVTALVADLKSGIMRLRPGDIRGGSTETVQPPVRAAAVGRWSRPEARSSAGSGTPGRAT